jgi:hypothetical protein
MVDARSSRSLQYLSLRTAASLAYMRLVGSPPDLRDTEAMRRVLDDVAHALAIIAPIRIYDHEGLTPMDQRKLLTGRFVRGAAALVDLEGQEHRNLVVQRGELESAIQILKQTQLPQTLQAAHRKQNGSSSRRKASTEESSADD